MNKNFYKLGIIGYPLSHSISPTIQTTALKSVGLSGLYEKFEVPKEDLKKQIEFFKSNDFTGFNVTIPHKIEILKYLQKIDSTATKIGAVNTVKIESDGTLTGYNTDIYGFIKAIPQNTQEFKNAKILGCGGAALAVIFGLEEIGIKNITICARNIEKTEKFINEIKEKTNINFSIENIENQSSLENTDILINATPLGTKGMNETKMATTTNILETAKKDLFVYDLVYNPQETLLIKEAKQLNLNKTNGLDMLIWQGAKAFEIWTGNTPDTEAMKNAATEIL